MHQDLGITWRARDPAAGQIDQVPIFDRRPAGLFRDGWRNDDHFLSREIGGQRIDTTGPADRGNLQMDQWNLPEAKVPLTEIVRRELFARHFALNEGCQTDAGGQDQEAHGTDQELASQTFWGGLGSHLACSSLKRELRWLTKCFTANDAP